MYHVEQTNSLADKEVTGKQQVAQEGGRHGDPHLDNVVKGKVGDADHVLGLAPRVMVRVT